MLVWLLGLCVGMQSLSAQTVRGKVVDEDNMPLMGATILEVGTKNGVSSDFDGNFQLTLKNGGATLDISYIGYKSTKVQVQNRNNITVKLLPETTELKEVVVVGYGTQKKETVTGAISSVKGNKKMQLPMSPMRWLGVCQGLPPLSPVVSLVGMLPLFVFAG